MTIKIFIGNLNSDTTSDKLRPLFEKYGEVAECDVLKNFGFVHMTNKNDANKAIAQLDGYSVDGNNIRVELSTGKKGSGGGGGGKFDKKGFVGGPRSRPYGPPPPRDPRDYDRYPYPPLPPLPYDRYDPYYRYYMEREAYYARLGPLPGERSYPSGGARDRFPPPRDRLSDRYPPPDPRDRLPPPRSFMEERSRALPPDAYFRDRDPIAARPPPEYYDRKPLSGGRGGVEPVGAAGAAGGRGASGFGGGGDFYRNMDRPGANMGGAAGGGGLGATGNGPDFLGRQGQNSFGRQSGPVGGGGVGKPGDSQSSFATDPIFF